MFLVLDFMRLLGSERCLPCHGVPTMEHEALAITHHVPTTPGDYIALYGVRCLRWVAHRTYRDRFLHRSFPLVALAPVFPLTSVVAAHFGGVVRHSHYGPAHQERSSRLLDELHNKEMHYAAMLEFASVRPFDRCFIAVCRALCHVVYAVASLIAPRMGYRFVAYLAEEATVTLTHFVNDIDTGHIADVPATPMCVTYWAMPKGGPTGGCSLRDVVLRLRTDAMTHRDWNHHRANRGPI